MCLIPIIATLISLFLVPFLCPNYSPLSTSLYLSRFYLWAKKRWYLSFWLWLITWWMVSSSIHFPANDMISFFLMAEQYSIVYICYIFFICSSIDGLLDWFIVNSAAINEGSSFLCHWSLRNMLVAGLGGDRCSGRLLHRSHRTI
jgi:hypothetical protein